KMNQATDVPLSTQAVAILSTIPRYQGGDYVFSHSLGSRPISTFVEAKREIDQWITDHGYVVRDFVFHDFRRCLSTFCVQSGVPLQVTELVLSHSKKGALGSVAAV